MEILNFVVSIFVLPSNPWGTAHFVGDYLLQNDWMASKKKESSYRCFVHVLFYMIPFVLFCEFKVWQLLVIAAQHFIVDRTYIISWFIKVKGSGSCLKGSLHPWYYIIIDNISHILTIYIVSII